jgi:hypothetical protein
VLIDWLNAGQPIAVDPAGIEPRLSSSPVVAKIRRSSGLA